LSLGFNENDAVRLYDQKEDWMGINSGGRLFCTKRGCEFQSTVASEELHEHCQVIHHWKSHPCLEDNCKFIAYSSAALKQHSRFHTRKSSKHYDFRCTRAQCHTGFHRRLLLKEHENIHDNIQFECVFCPYTSVKIHDLAIHQRNHFKIRNYSCEICDKTFIKKSHLTGHYDQKHSNLTTKCPLCEKESTRQNIYNHLKYNHKIEGSINWNAEKKELILPDQN